MAGETSITIPNNYYTSKEALELPLTPKPITPVPPPPPATTLATYARQRSNNMTTDKTLSSAANLVKLLPTGTVLAFQALSPSFTKRGECYPSNITLTLALIIFCALSCVFFSITDSLRGCDGKIYYGLATFDGIYLFNYDKGELERCRVFTDLRRYRLTVLDFVHAFFTVLVFLSISFSTSDVQKCLFPDAGPNSKELVVNLPLGAAVVSSLVFMIFPTCRKGIGYSDSAPASQ